MIGIFSQCHTKIACPDYLPVLDSEESDVDSDESSSDSEPNESADDDDMIMNMFEY